MKPLHIKACVELRQKQQGETGHPNSRGNKIGTRSDARRGDDHDIGLHCRNNACYMFDKKK